MAISRLDTGLLTIFLTAAADGLHDLIHGTALGPISGGGDDRARVGEGAFASIENPDLPLARLVGFQGVGHRFRLHFEDRRLFRLRRDGYRDLRLILCVGLDGQGNGDSSARSRREQ